MASVDKAAMDNSWAMGNGHATHFRLQANVPH